MRKKPHMPVLLAMADKRSMDVLEAIFLCQPGSEEILQ